MNPSGYARQSFMVELEKLEHSLLEMGSKAETMVSLAVEALTNMDVELAHDVCRRDDEIDALDLEIEDRCLLLLALEHPIAGDLRTVSTAMKMITDIERVGDLAVEIAKITLKIDKELGKSDIIDIPKMAKVAMLMVREALEAYVKRDLQMVNLICQQDDEVDDLYRELRQQLFTSMKSDASNVVTDSWLLLAIHHVERIADHAVNIGERVHFMVTGRFEQLVESHKPLPTDNT